MIYDIVEDILNILIERDAPTGYGVLLKNILDLLKECKPEY